VRPVAGKGNMPLDLLDEEDDVFSPADSIAALRVHHLLLIPP
jgi:hypothetical protein